MKLSYNLQWYVDKIKAGEKFSLARYGDGELACMWGKGRQNSNGCLYTTELRTALLDSMNHRRDSSFIYGLQRVLSVDEERVFKEYDTTNWHDTEIFSEAVASGDLFPFIEAIRNKKVVIIGNFSIVDATKDIFPQRWFLQVPPMNAYFVRDYITTSIEWVNKFDKGVVYLFSCGMAANAIISELHGKVDGWLIDVGHIWDPFAGSLSRCDLEGKTQEDIRKNLHEKAE